MQAPGIASGEGRCHKGKRPASTLASNTDHVRMSACLIVHAYNSLGYCRTSTALQLYCTGMTMLGLLESSMLENDARPEMAVDQFQVDFRCHGVSTVGITETT